MGARERRSRIALSSAVLWQDGRDGWPYCTAQQALLWWCTTRCPLHVSALERLKQRKRTDLQHVAEQQSDGHEQQCLQQQLQHMQTTLLSQDRLLPQMSVQLHSSYKSGCQLLNTGDQLLLGYGTAYRTFS